MGWEGIAEGGGCRGERRCQRHGLGGQRGSEGGGVRRGSVADALDDGEDGHDAGAEAQDRAHDQGPEGPARPLPAGGGGSPLRPHGREDSGSKECEGCLSHCGS